MPIFQNYDEMVSKPIGPWGKQDPTSGFSMPPAPMMPPAEADPYMDPGGEPSQQPHPALLQTDNVPAELEMGVPPPPPPLSNSPLAIPGSFAQPGSEGARPYQSPDFFAGRVTPEPERGGMASLYGGMGGFSGLEGGGRDDEYARAILQRLGLG